VSGTQIPLDATVGAGTYSHRPFWNVRGGFQNHRTRSRIAQMAHESPLITAKLTNELPRTGCKNHI